MPIHYLAHLRAESARFAAVLRDARPAARVPSCPDWDADDLLWHVAEVFNFWGTIVHRRLLDPAAANDAEPPRPSGHAELLALYARTSAGLIAALEATEDSVHVWSWSADETVGFARRRMAHEALIHRLDAELTAGTPSGVDAGFAADGVHEALQHCYGGHPEWATYRADGPVGRLRATDTGDEWLIRLGGFSGVSPNTGRSYAHEPTLELVPEGAASFTLSAGARDLDAWLWNRPTLVEPMLEGSAADYRGFADLIAKGVD